MPARGAGAPPESDDPDPEPPADDESPPPATVGRFNPARLDLERAIEQLPPGYRAALVLHDVEGYDHREIASMLGIAEGTSKSQVHKARVRMRQLLSSG